MRTTEMWGVRFGHMLILRGCRSERDVHEALLPLVADLKEYNAVVMEAEDLLLPYCYLMFFSKEDAEEFYEKHKGERFYKKAKIRLIKEPANVPTAWLKAPAEA